MKSVLDRLKKWPLWLKVLVPVLTVVGIAALSAGIWLFVTYDRMHDDSVGFVDRPSEVIPESELPDLPDLPDEGPDDTPSLSEGPDGGEDAGYADESPAVSFDPTDIYIEEQQRDDIYNILLVGIDARPGQSYGRSDTMILLSYDSTKHSVKLISFMRDMWVTLPERGWQRINAAMAYGGIGLLINTVNYNFDLDVQNYVTIRFDEFRKVIDILGGVDVELTKSEINYINSKLHSEDKDYKNDIKSGAGVVHLNGAQALWYCRDRNSPDGDFSRTNRQRKFLTRLIDKGLEMNIADVPVLVTELSKHVRMNLDLDLIFELVADAYAHKSELTVETYNVPFDGMWSFANKNGASVIEINRAKITQRLHDIIGYDG